VDIAEEMKEVYAVYCRNHDDAISLMEKVLLLKSFFLTAKPVCWKSNSQLLLLLNVVMC